MHRHSIPFVVLAGFAMLAALAGSARADEIIFLNPETCEKETLRVYEVVSETWTEVRYKEKKRSPTKGIPASQVVDIVRENPDAAAKSLLNAIKELERGNLTEARRALRSVSGGGRVTDFDTGELVYKPFDAGDPAGKRRPSWVSEYAHFFLAKALYLEGAEKKNTDLLTQAREALVDMEVRGPDGMIRTGGFEKRFQGGNSRWYAEALALKAKTLLALGLYKEATAAFGDLFDRTLKVADLGPRWTYESKAGPGEVAEAQGDHNKAIQAYIAASNFMLILLKGQVDACELRELGRFYSLGRVRAASVRLAQAEETGSAAQFKTLRKFVDDGSPVKLRSANRGLPADRQDALVAGAMDPLVQAVYQNCRGLAHLKSSEYEEAILAFRSVEVQYFQVPEERARALHYLAKAADGAAKQARGAETRTYFEKLRDSALARLRGQYPDSPWAYK